MACSSKEVLELVPHNGCAHGHCPQAGLNYRPSAY
uniref:Uncharacterized protein n=1 Tax=Peronospora matthiolae TaxID=2874970 RepID=A0AAV1VNW6_9STRA